MAFDFYMPDIGEGVVEGEIVGWKVKGDVRFLRFDQLLRADTLRYDAETTDYDAVGNVRYQDRDLLMSAESAKGNADLDRCTLDGPDDLLADGPLGALRSTVTGEAAAPAGAAAENADRCTAGPPSPPKPATPVPASVVIAPQRSTLRTR